MPSMSAVEQRFCRSGVWGLVARRVILPWALQGHHLDGELLEIGGGSGAMAAGAARSFPDLRLTVTDIDPAMVNTARQRLHDRPNVVVERADVTDLPFADESFDYVVSYLMLHHVVGWQQALVEAARVLRPGGKLIGYDLSKTRVAEWIHRADRSPHRLVDVDELGPASREAGLEMVDVRPARGSYLIRFAAAKSMSAPSW